MKKTIFTGAGVAIITPMFEDGTINYDKLGELIDFQIENHTDSIIVCGTTGESATMTDQEHIDAIAYTVKHVNGRIPVIAGAGSNDTKYAVELSKEAKSLGADALLHVTPYYNKTSQRGLIKHFTDIADATDLPIILYNVPSRTGTNIAVDTYKVLSAHQNIVAAKEASGDISAIAKIKAACGNDLAIYSGNDDQIVPILSLGGIGVISVLSNALPKQTHDICELYFKGDVKASAKLQLDLLEFINALFMDVNPIPVKEAMNLMGLQVGECRMPLLKMTQQQIQKLSDVMKKINLI
ncbi:4-hydroxy-tetrahydrodipicolinate synthase [Paludicola sp. MB14-C6]|uniref:4-hydroxy-tetrahydrodipicolinate synthase n=1 Tax=Paludihabitans sp. MB14-C6 TaxID=3070656 RepID=UPI0027DD6523|nr:4-hydroxy-tetrahydrodipicolinate synthase [Paludicola sp. MB14-C6]WMJ23057.1 4-hydroxy-tetrahydrodipicolinate synthase [Paludicola sp. MB14-C6]